MPDIQVRACGTLKPLSTLKLTLVWVREFLVFLTFSDGAETQESLEASKCYWNSRQVLRQRSGCPTGRKFQGAGRPDGCGRGAGTGCRVKANK